jgi:hypothetical protein
MKRLWPPWRLNVKHWCRARLLQRAPGRLHFKRGHKALPTGACMHRAMWPAAFLLRRNTSNSSAHSSTQQCMQTMMLSRPYRGRASSPGCWTAGLNTRHVTQQLQLRAWGRQATKDHLTSSWNSAKLRVGCITSDQLTSHI